MRSVVLIPARLGAQRFPNKPLAMIAGKPMIQHVFEAAEASEATDVFVATEDREIMDAVSAFGGAAILTSSDPINGTERCIEALELLDPEGKAYDVVINVQGDEPLLQAENINQMLTLFQEEDVDVVTLIQAIEDEAEYRNPNVVKAVPSMFQDDFCDICYFSRSPIPYMKEFTLGLAFKHIGVYGFTATALEEVKDMLPSPLEQAESLEQLRWIQNHLVISGVLCHNQLIGVDTAEDLLAVENLLK